MSDLARIAASDLAFSEAVESEARRIAGNPTVPDTRPLSAVLVDLDACIARVTELHSAVTRLGWRGEYAESLLDEMLSDLTNAVRVGDKAATSLRHWKATP